MPVEVTKGEAARDAFLATVTASSVEAIGGYRTYASSSYYTGAPVGEFEGTLLPSQDIYTGSFVPTPVWQAVATESTDTVSSTGATSASSAAEAFTIGFAAPTPTPNNLEQVIVRVDAAKVGTGTAPESSSATLDVSLIDGVGTVRTTRTFGPLTASVYPSYTVGLSRNDIRGVNWDNAQIQCKFNLSVEAGVATGSISGSVRYVAVDFRNAGKISAAPKDETLWRIVY